MGAGWKTGIDCTSIPVRYALLWALELVPASIDFRRLASLAVRMEHGAMFGLTVTLFFALWTSHGWNGTM